MMATREISAACSECGADVAITVPDGEDVMLTHVAFVREQAAHAVRQHGQNWGVATHTAVRQYSRTFVVTALQQWHDQHALGAAAVPPITT